MTDLHLDNASSADLKRITREIAASNHHAALVTGDISCSRFLCEHLEALAKACHPRPLYFTLGNHDFHGSTFAQTHDKVRRLCRSIRNLHHLEDAGPVPLGDHAALVGHAGWADAACGWGARTVIPNPDHECIQDFRKISVVDRFRLMRDLGRESSISIRNSLFGAFRTRRHVIVATHVPPFPSTAMYDGTPCGPCHQPHFVNMGMGAMLIAVANRNPTRRITVLAGHTHSPAEQSILANLHASVGLARTGQPRIQRTLHL